MARVTHRQAYTINGMNSENTNIRLPELLAPAGKLESLAAAVAAGADAVYLGLGKLNARVSAAGFTWPELAHGCALAHVHSVRVYGALNIFLYDEEFEAAFDLVRQAQACGVDAFIVADLGLIDALNKEFPGIEIHLSTQAGVHAPEGLELMRRELGVQRACVGRELSVAEIAELCTTGIPVETFVHGAICISYSGECMFSALRRGRSAMRGDCTQPCRATYDLMDEDGKSVVAMEGDKLICPHDYLGIAHISELCAAGVHALKIEGRMKSPDYVYNVVRTYRYALDCVAAGRTYDAAALTEQLSHSFNRGFTDIYLRGARAGADLMSFERSINQGTHVGRVIERAYQKIYVAFDKPVHAGDMLEVRFYPGEHTAPDAPKRWPQLVCPIDVAAGETIFVRCKRKVEVNSEVYLTTDNALKSEAQAAVDGLLASKLQTAPNSSENECDSEKTAKISEHKNLAAYRSPDVVEALEGKTIPQDAIVLDEMLRADNRREMLGKIQRAKAAGIELICRNISEVELCREAGVTFSVAKPIFCSNSRTEELLKSWGASHIYQNDPRRQLMVMDHCVLTAAGPCTENCATCTRRQAKHYLVEQDGHKIEVTVDAHGRSRLFDTAEA